MQAHQIAELYVTYVQVHGKQKPTVAMLIAVEFQDVQVLIILLQTVTVITNIMHRYQPDCTALMETL
jgi:hypothetical protein